VSCRFYPIEIDYSGDDGDELAIKQKAQELRRTKCKLDQRIQVSTPGLRVCAMTRKGSLVLTLAIDDTTRRI
jgi:hypothetical protein